MARTSRMRGPAQQEVSQEQPKRLTARMAKLLEVPESTVGDLPSIEFSGNSEAVVEGCKGVLEYSTERVRLGGGTLLITFRGQGLELKGMTAHSAIITGNIQSVEFSN